MSKKQISLSSKTLESKKSGLAVKAGLKAGGGSAKVTLANSVKTTLG